MSSVKKNRGISKLKTPRLSSKPELKGKIMKDQYFSTKNIAAGASKGNNINSHHDNIGDGKMMPRQRCIAKRNSKTEIPITK